MSQNSQCKILEWDSNFYSVRVARIKEHRLTNKSIDRIFEWCGDHKIDCLYFLCAPDDDDSVTAAENAGFHLVDVRVELHCQTTAEAINEESSVRRYRESDLPALDKIVDEAYTDSRFYYDRNFSRDRTSALYREWVLKCCRGDADAVFVVDYQGQPGGFITCHFGPSGVGRIGLIGVSQDVRGNGIGSALIKSSLNFFQSHGVIEVRVVTQGRNIKAQRLYQTNGFKTCSVSLYYHKWFFDDRTLENQSFVSNSVLILPIAKN